MISLHGLRFSVIAFVLIAAQLPASATAGILWASPRLFTGLANRPVPKPVANQVTKVSLGGEHTLYLKQDRTLWAVGRNQYGQSGGLQPDPNFFDQYHSHGRQIGSDVVDMVAADNLSVFLTSDGRLWILGSNPANDFAIPNPGQLDANVVSFAAISGKLFYIRNDGRLYGMGQYVGTGAAVTNVPTSVATNVASVTASRLHSLFVKTDGTLWASGTNVYGQLGTGDTSTQLTPVQVASGVSKAYAGAGVSYFIKTDGSLWGMGLNDFGQQGDGTTINRLSPVHIDTGGDDVTAVSVYGSSAYFIKADGTLWAMGRNDRGQLGVGDFAPHTSPVLVAADVTQVHAASLHAQFLKTDGTLWAMGYNYYGQLGDGSRTDRDVPVQVAADVQAAATSVAAHSAYIDSAGELWTMGRNLKGQLADGVAYPDFAWMAEDVVSVDMGNEFGLYAKSDGKLWFTALGQNTDITGTVVAVGVGEFDTGLAYLKSDGTLWELAWEGSSTQLASDVSSFGLLGSAVAYVKNDGSLWGETLPGRTPSTSANFGTNGPLQLAASGVTSLSTALTHLFFTKNDHTLWGVGSPLGGWGSGILPGQYASSAVQLKTGVVASSASLISQLYITTDGVLWDQGVGWAGSPSQIADGVAQAATGQLENYYIKTDGTLWRNGFHIGDDVTAVSAGTESGAMFIQTSGAGGAPQITGHPQSATVTYGESVLLEVEANGGSPLDYQWFKDGVAVPTARSQYLSLGYATTGDAGNYTVRVKNSAGSVTSSAATLAIKAAPEITWPDPAAISHGTALSGTQLNATADVAGTFAYTPAAGTILDAGTRVLSVTFTPADTTTHGVVTAQRAITVNKAAATVTLGNLSATYDGSAKPATATTNPAGKTVVITYNGSTSAPTAAGSYAVVATINDPNYAGSASGTLVIAKASQSAPTINSAASLTFGAGYTATVSGSGFGAVEWALGTGSTANGAAINSVTGVVSYASIGTVILKARFAGDANCEPSAYTSDFTVTVNPAPTTFTLDFTNRTYNSLPQSPTIIPTPSNATFTAGGTTSATNAGDYTVTATATGNYTGTNNSLSWTIERATVGIILGNLSATYDGAPKLATATTIPAGLAVAFAYDGSPAAPTSPGSYAVMATIDHADYYGHSAGTLVIAKANQGAPTISSAASFTFGDSYTATATASGFGALEWALGTGSTATGAAIHASTGAVTTTGVGTVKIKVRFAGDANRNPSAYTADFTVTVNPIPTTFVLSATGFTYNGSSQGPTVNAMPDTATFATGGTLSATNAGSYTTTATANGNYTGANASLDWTIAKASVSVTLGNLNAVFDGQSHTPTATTVPSGMTVGFTYNGSPVAPTMPGSYAVVATINDPNYMGAALGTLVIVDDGPVITSQSAVRNVVAPGQTLILSVGTVGTGTLNYQWSHNGQPITAGVVSSGNGSSLTVNAVALSHGGWYRVTITNAAGTVSSAPFFVAVAATSTYVWGWGLNFDGQTTPPAGLGDAIAVAAGDRHSLALRRDGTVVAWGDNTHGQATVPNGLTGVVNIAAGYSHSVALKADGTVVTWGQDLSGVVTSLPPDLSEVVAITAGVGYSLALKADGTLVGWGNYGFGQLVTPGDLTSVVAIAGGWYHVVALKTDGTVAAWGENSNGQSSVPGGLGGVIAVAATSIQSTALKNDGTVIAWDVAGYDVPPGLTGVVALTGGKGHTLALKNDGSVVGWGSNLHGDPSPPVGLTNAFAITAGSDFSLTLLNKAAPVITWNNAAAISYGTVLSATQLNATADVAGTFVYAPAAGALLPAGIQTLQVTFTPADSVNYATVVTSTSLVVNPIPTTFALSATGFTYNGSSQGPTVNTTPGNATFATGGTLSATNAGSYTATATANGNYTGANASLDWTIAKANQGAPTISSASSFTFGGSYTATASGSGFGALEWALGTGSSAGGAAINASTGAVTATSAGTVVVKVRLAGDANHNASPYTSDFAVTVLPLESAPVITAHPPSRSAYLGQTVELKVVATATPAPDFQWFKDDQLITGATTSVLTLSGLTQTDAGNYWVQVSNSSGTVVSSIATLTIKTGTPPATITDFNGDGRTDWLWQNMATGERSFWFMNGAAVAGGSSLGIVPVEWQIGVTADFNADGQSDLLWQNSVSGERVIWLMQNGLVAGSVSLGVLTVDWQIAACADFSGDGSPDIVWQHTVTGNRVIWTLSGTSVTGGGFIGNLSTEWSICASADLNQDGQSDLVMQNIATGERAVWVMNDMTVIDSVSFGTMSLDWSICGAGDLNADGKDDLYLQNALTGERLVWYMNGLTKSSEQVVTTLGTDWALFIPPLIRRTYADFDGNGKTDLVWQNSTTKAVRLWLLDGTALDTEVTLGTLTLDERLAGSGDFDGDSQADLVIHNQVSGEVTVRFYDGVTFLESVSVGTRPLAWQIACTGDFNRDGRADLVWQNTSTGAREIWLMNGATQLSTADLGIVALDWQIAASGDFDSDGRSDLVWQNTVSGERLIWFMSGTVVRAAQTIATVPLGWKIVGTGDFNGDTKTDIIWQNSDSGDRLVWIMVGTLVGGGLSLGNQPLVWDIRN